MKKKIIASVVAVGAVLLGGVAVRAALGTPEIDRANATIQLTGTLKSHSCAGEDSIRYITYSGAWNGGETQMLPDPTDYTLSGSMSVTGIKWTTNLSTGRGVLTGTVTLSSAAGGPQYSGKLTLVTQGVPAAGAAVPGRGWIVAGFLPADEGATPGDDNLIANVEFLLSPSSANGQFGDAPGSLGIPDFSAVTNVAPKALDGTC
jgi:hypothetical protein